MYLVRRTVLRGAETRCRTPGEAHCLLLQAKWVIDRARGRAVAQIETWHAIARAEPLQLQSQPGCGGTAYVSFASPVPIQRLVHGTYPAGLWLVRRRPSFGLRIGYEHLRWEQMRPWGVTRPEGLSGC